MTTRSAGDLKPGDRWREASTGTAMRPLQRNRILRVTGTRPGWAPSLIVVDAVDDATGNAESVVFYRVNQVTILAVQEA